MSSPLPAIEISGLTKDFKGVRAVDDLSFRVDHGQVCGLLGPNGAGKTTTLRALVGLILPTAGSAQLLGVTMTPSNPVLERVGTMIEHSDFVPFLSGMRNLRLHWEESGGDFSTANEEALAIADLGNAINRKVKTYSQGMRQRLGIARALLGRPEVMVLDEPTNGLDPGEMREIRELLLRLAAHGTTVLLSSHLLSEVEQVCSHVVVMDRGRLVAAGTIAEITAATGTAAYVDVDDVARAEKALTAISGVRSVHVDGRRVLVELDGAQRWQLVDALVHAGVHVEAVESSHRLEDAFLGLLAQEHD
jgi:ABC-2 type transport system ATP-binding protein